MDEAPRAVPSLCAVIPDLALGGVAVATVGLLSSVVQAGRSATVIAESGPLAERARAAGIAVHVIAPELDMAARYQLVAALAQGHDAALVDWTPTAIGALPAALAATGRAVLVRHGAARHLDEWALFEPERAFTLARGAIDDPACVVCACGAAHRREMAECLAVDEQDLAILPEAVDAARIPFQPCTGESRTILAMVRLSIEKAPVVELAAGLTARALAAGRPVHLDVVGEGPWQAEALALCGRLLPPAAWSHEPATERPLERLARADVCVTQGLTTIETAALGRRVVVARHATAASGVGGTVLTPATYAGAAEDPFAVEQVEHDLDRLWDGLDAIGPGELAALRSLVEERNSPPRQLAALVELVASLEPAPRPRQLLEAAGLLAAQSGDRALRVWRELAELRHAGRSAGAD